jgi:hypothetical protein
MAKVLKSKQVEAGLAIVAQYLKEEFPDCDIELIDPDGPDGTPDRNPLSLSRSFWVDFQGPQRLLFAIELIEIISNKESTLGLNILRQMAIAGYVKNSARVPIKVTLRGPELC